MIGRCSLKAFFAFGALAGLAGAGLADVVENPNASFNGFVWRGPTYNYQGTFIYDNTQPTSWEEFFASPVREFTWNNIRHSGATVQYSQEYTPGYGTEIFFTGGQVGQDWYALRFLTREQYYPTRPESLEYNPGSAGDDPVEWVSVEFQYTDEGGLVRTVPVQEIYHPFLLPVSNTVPQVVQARINGVDADLVLDEKRGNYSLALDALAVDAEGGVLSFTVDGEGPEDSASTLAGSLRLSHTVTRTISGDDRDSPYHFTFDVRDPLGWGETVTRTVSVRNLDPVIERFDLQDPDRLVRQLGESLSFLAEASDPGGDPLTYSWDLDGDGDYDDFVGRFGSMIFDTQGQQTLSLLVEDADGGQAIRSVTFTVVPEPGVLLFLVTGSVGLLRRRR
jgi:hypothetical protein